MARTKTNTQSDTKTRTTPLRNKHLRKKHYMFVFNNDIWRKHRTIQNENIFVTKWKNIFHTILMLFVCTGQAVVAPGLT